MPRSSFHSRILPSQSPSMYDVWLARTLRSELMEEKKLSCCCECLDDSGVDTYDTFDEVERAELDLRKVGRCKTRLTINILTRFR